MIMEIENIVANTVLLKAREGKRDSGWGAEGAEAGSCTHSERLEPDCMIERHAWYVHRGCGICLFFFNVIIAACCIEETPNGGSNFNQIAPVQASSSITPVLSHNIWGQCREQSSL